MTNAWFDNGIVQLYQADARSLPIPDNSVDCVVTSPPYWGLRDYGLGVWFGGDEDCDHKGPAHRTQSGFNERWYGKQFQNDKQGSLHEPYKSICGKCGAKRIDNGIGLEPTPEAYCANMVAVFREVWRVLKPTGTLWLNLGDSYASDTKGSGGPSVKQLSNAGSFHNGSQRLIHGLKPKDLVGIPWRVAFALQTAGWYLRSDIIWSKPNPMPESVTDRPTKAHEYIFLLTKSPRYYYDADAIREKYEGLGTPRAFAKKDNKDRNDTGRLYEASDQGGRNKRTVWEITTQPYPEAHFATYPEKLVEPCILAGTSEKGVCAECGKPWERTLTRIDDRHWSERGDYSSKKLQALKSTGFRNDGGGAFEGSAYKPTGWEPTCECNADIVPATVLDPFSGSGTTIAVAQRLGRRAIGTDLSAEYLSLASKRVGKVTLPLF